MTAGVLVGSSQVIVADARNPTATAKATVKVLPPEELHFISQHLEVEIGRVLEIPISVSAFADEGKIL